MALQNKEEVFVDNLDKSLFSFTKKNLILVHRNVSDFYQIRLKKNIFADNNSNPQQ